MENDKSYSDIIYLEVGINNLAGNGYKVKYDFNRNLITWNDGYMWNNNFMKHMNADKLNTIREKLPKTNMLEWLVGYINEDNDKFGNVTANPATWEVIIKFNDGTELNGTCTQHFPSDWNLLRQMIEQTTGCTFRLH